jgi:non-canonical (house-cleaning) NTP pyrophosphatase
MRWIGQKVFPDRELVVHKVTGTHTQLYQLARRLHVTPLVAPPQVNAPSGVPDQPMGDAQTKRGAINRALVRAIRRRLVFLSVERILMEVPTAIRRL